MRPTVNVLYLPGTNCHAETIRAFSAAGGKVQLIFLSDVLAGCSRLDSADILCIPGGFSFGDHAGAGAVAGLLLTTRLRAQFLACLRRPTICICNGFQIAVRAGCFGSGLALKANRCGTFVDVPHQLHTVVEDNDSLWLRGLGGSTLAFPCAHGEGRFLYNCAGNWSPALVYPADQNPDGSMDDIGGVTTRDGLVFGLMDHPERAQDQQVRLAFIENGLHAVSG